MHIQCAMHAVKGKRKPPSLLPALHGLSLCLSGTTCPVLPGRHEGNVSGEVLNFRLTCIFGTFGTRKEGGSKRCLPPSHNDVLRGWENSVSCGSSWTITIHNQSPNTTQQGFFVALVNSKQWACLCYKRDRSADNHKARIATSKDLPLISSYVTASSKFLCEVLLRLSCSLPASPPIQLPMHLPARPPARPPTGLPACLPAHLPARLPACAPACLPVSLPAYLLCASE